MPDDITIDIVEPVTNITVDTFPGGAVWGNIVGTLSAQSDLWAYLSAETFSPSQLTAFLVTNSLTLCSIDVRGLLLSAGVDLFDIFLTSETESQTLSYTPSSYDLSISNSNTVNLSSINSTFAANSGKYESSYNTATAYSSVSSSFATNTTLESVSSLLTPLTLTNNLTSQLVLNTAFDNYQTNVANATATLLPTSLYQGASGFWQGASTIVQQGSSNWYSASGAAFNAAKGYTHQNFVPLSGGAVIGDSLTVSGDLYVLSSVYISGSAFYVNAEDLIVTDPIIYIAEDNQTDFLDIGFMGSWTRPPGYPTGYQHGGLVRRAGSDLYAPGVWTLFSGATSEPLSALNVEWNQQGIVLDPLSAKFYGDIYGDRNVYGSLSSTGVVYAQNGNSDLWNEAYTTVQSNSTNWILQPVETLSALNLQTIPLSTVTFTGEIKTSTTSVTATDVYVKVIVNDETKYLRLFDVI